MQRYPPYPDTLALVSKVGARRDESGEWLSYDEPDQLRRGIEDNVRGLGAEQLAAVNLRLMDDANAGPTVRRPARHHDSGA